MKALKSGKERQLDDFLLTVKVFAKEGLDVLKSPLLTSRLTFS